MNAEFEQIQIDDQMAEHCFSNFSFCKTGPEEVCIGFGVRDLQDHRRVSISHYFHLTIPHFLRLADLFNQQILLLEEKGVIQRNFPQ